MVGGAMTELCYQGEGYFCCKELFYVLEDNW